MHFSRRKSATHRHLQRTLQFALLLGTVWLLVSVAIPPLLLHWGESRQYLTPRTVLLPLPAPWGPLLGSISPLRLAAANFFALSMVGMGLLVYRIARLAQHLSGQHARWYHEGLLHRTGFVASRRLKDTLYLFALAGALWILAWVGAPGLADPAAAVSVFAPWTLGGLLFLLAAMVVLTVRVRYLLTYLEEAGEAHFSLTEVRPLPAAQPDPLPIAVEPSADTPPAEFPTDAPPAEFPAAAMAEAPPQLAPVLPATTGGTARLLVAATAVIDLEEETLAEPWRLVGGVAEPPDTEPATARLLTPWPAAREAYPPRVRLAEPSPLESELTEPLGTDPAPAEPASPEPASPFLSRETPAILAIACAATVIREPITPPAALTEGSAVTEPAPGEPTAGEPAVVYQGPEEPVFEQQFPEQQLPEQLPDALPAADEELAPAASDPADERSDEPAEPEPEVPVAVAAVEGEPVVDDAAGPDEGDGEAPDEGPPGAFPCRVGWLLQGRAVVAVDLSHGAAKVLQGIKTRDGVVLTGAGCFAISPGVYQRGQILDAQSLSGLVRETLHDLGIRSRRVACCVGGESSILRTVTFPRMTEGELKEALKWEAEKYFPFRYEEAVVDFKLADISTRQLWDTPEVVDGQVPVMLGACQRRVVSAFTDTFKHAKLNLVELEPHPLATFRALRYTQGVQNLTGVVALVDVGLESAYTTIFKHGYPLLHRSVNRSLFSPAVRESLDATSVYTVPPFEDWRVEQVLNEVGRSLEAALMQLKPAKMRVFMTGEGAMAPGIEEKLNLMLQNLFAGRLAMEAEPILRAFSWTRDRRWPKPIPPLLAAAPPLWAGALGLLLRGLQVSVARPGVVIEAIEGPSDLYREVV